MAGGQRQPFGPEDLLGGLGDLGRLGPQTKGLTELDWLLLQKRKPKDLGVPASLRRLDLKDFPLEAPHMRGLLGVDLEEQKRQKLLSFREKRREAAGVPGMAADLVDDIVDQPRIYNLEKSYREFNRSHWKMSKESAVAYEVLEEVVGEGLDDAMIIRPPRKYSGHLGQLPGKPRTPVRISRRHPWVPSTRGEVKKLLAEVQRRALERVAADGSLNKKKVLTGAMEGLLRSKDLPMMHLDGDLFLESAPELHDSYVAWRRRNIEKDLGELSKAVKDPIQIETPSEVRYAHQNPYKGEGGKKLKWNEDFFDRETRLRLYGEISIEEKANLQKSLAALNRGDLWQAEQYHRAASRGKQTRQDILDFQKGEKYKGGKYKGVYVHPVRRKLQEISDNPKLSKADKHAARQDLMKRYKEDLLGDRSALRGHENIADRMPKSAARTLSDAMPGLSPASGPDPVIVGQGGKTGLNSPAEDLAISTRRSIKDLRKPFLDFERTFDKEVSRDRTLAVLREAVRTRGAEMAKPGAGAQAAGYVEDLERLGKVLGRKKATTRLVDAGGLVDLKVLKRLLGKTPSGKMVQLLKLLDLVK